ncbi:MAG: orotidine-5'-phosphate decarboxylase [Akkermansiaceae bacterium]|nr:orotidine-5'-phosphate decarboxylase [Akkermansiaceae bacterium]
MAAERFSERLAARIAATGSHLCVGLDPRVEQHGGDPLAVESFLRQVIEETAAHAAAFKPNSAYFEALGSDGVAMLEQIIELIPEEVPVILDVKRSDIGATQERYAEACFERWGADAATLNPFMGYDSIVPFLDHPGRGVYLLAVTSNPGSADIQRRECGGRKIYEFVGEFAERARSEGAATDVGLVVGLTNAGEEVLAGLPDVPLLVPGLGAQGGDLGALAGTGRQAPIVVNVSRGVLYGEDGTPGSRAAGFRAQIATALD